MTIINIHLPENYRYDHFILTVIEKSDASEIRNQTHRLDEAGNTLRAATLSATPPEQEKTK